jgi:transcriptional regulator with XRE-family HTH domain
MSSGYSLRVAEAIRKANGRSLGVQLGRACLAQDISVLEVAAALGVSRQTVYQWFTGVSAPRGAACELIELYLKSLGQK